MFLPPGRNKLTADNLVYEIIRRSKARALAPLTRIEDGANDNVNDSHQAIHQRCCDNNIGSGRGSQPGDDSSIKLVEASIFINDRDRNCGCNATNCGKSEIQLLLRWEI